MGVGVFESTFGGTGRTFIVSGPLATDEDYNNYVRDCEEGNEDPDVMSREEWAQEQYNEENYRLLEIVTQAMSNVGFTAEKRGRFDSPRADFDSDFAALAGNDLLQIGWRAWEGDFIIGVGAAGRWREWIPEPDAFGRDIIDESHRAPALMAESYGELSEVVFSHLLATLQSCDMECRYKTSGYTTSRYPKPASIEEHVAETAAAAAVQRQALEVGPRTALWLSSEKETTAFINAVKTLQSEDFDPRISTLYRADEGVGVTDVDAITGDAYAQWTPKPEQLAAINALVEPGQPIPRKAETASLFAEREASTRDRYFFSVAELAAAGYTVPEPQVNEEAGPTL